MATFLFTFLRCGILEAQRCYASSPSKVNHCRERTFLCSQASVSVMCWLAKINPLWYWAQPSVPLSPTVNWGPHSSTYCGQQMRGKEGNYILIKAKLDALYSQNSFSIKFPKKNPLAENKHWKNFQISVRTLSLSVCFSGSLPVSFFLSLFLSLFLSVFFSLSLSLSPSLPLLLLCLFWKLRNASNVDPRAVYTEPDGSSD